MEYRLAVCRGWWVKRIEEKLWNRHRAFSGMHQYFDTGSRRASQHRKKWRPLHCSLGDGYFCLSCGQSWSWMGGWQSMQMGAAVRDWEQAGLQSTSWGKDPPSGLRPRGADLLISSGRCNPCGVTGTSNSWTFHFWGAFTPGTLRGFYTSSFRLGLQIGVQLLGMSS